MAVEVEQVEDHVVHRQVPHPPPDGRFRGQVHARLEPLEAGTPLLVQGHHLAVQDHALRPQAPRQLTQLRVARGEVGEVAPLEREVPVVAVGERADPVPFDLEAEGRLVTGQGAGARLHRRDSLGQRLVSRVVRRVHAVDEPVGAAGADERVAPAHALAVELRDHLVVAELLRVVGPRVPDLHGPAAVLALRDLALELEVLERMVLGVHGQAVLLRVLGHAAREGPRRQRPLVLEPQVPVEPAGVVLLDHEAPRRRRRLPVPGGLGRGSEVPLAPVALEPVRHALSVPDPGPEGLSRRAACDRSRGEGPRSTRTRPPPRHRAAPAPRSRR